MAQWLTRTYTTAVTIRIPMISFPIMEKNKRNDSVANV